MGNYISSIDAKMLAQVSYKDLGFDNDSEYEGWLDGILIPQVEALLERYCGGLPSGFFKTAGVTVTSELHDYNKHFITLDYRPATIVTTVELNQAACGETASWTATTKYVANLRAGYIKLVNVYPSCYDQGVRVTYTAGYAAMPGDIELIAGQLCSNVLHGILQRKVNPIVQVGDFSVRVLIPEAFTTELKNRLKPYIQQRVSVG